MTYLISYKRIMVIFETWWSLKIKDMDGALYAIISRIYRGSSEKFLSLFRLLTFELSVLKTDVSYLTKK